MEREQLRTALSVWNISASDEIRSIGVTKPYSQPSVWNLSASDEIRSIGVTKRDLLAALRLEHLGE